MLTAIGLALAGRAVARLATSLGMPTGRDRLCGPLWEAHATAVAIRTATRGHGAPVGSIQSVP
jgi:hypothetical protein